MATSTHPSLPQVAFVFADLRLTFFRPVYRGRRAGAVSFRLFFLGMGDWLLSGLLAHGRDHLGDRSNGSVEAHGTLQFLYALFASSSRNASMRPAWYTSMKASRISMGGYLSSRA